MKITKEKTEEELFEDTEIIYSYTQQQAIEDGLLVDISEYPLVKEAGFKAPLVVTAGVYDLLKPPKELERWQDFDGRLWDLLVTAKIEIKRMIAREDWFGEFKANFQISLGKTKTKRFFITFSSSEGFTIMFPEEY